MSRSIVVLDLLAFESLNNANLSKYLSSDDYFVVLWTSRYSHANVLQSIPYDGFINGLRNGHKPYRYLRMYLRKYHPSVLYLPVIIVDFEKYYHSSRFGYDLCIDINSLVVQQLYNSRPINVINTKMLFEQIDHFVDDYVALVRHTVNEETILSNSIVLTSNDMFQQRKPPRIVNKTCVLVVAPSIFEMHHNVHCAKFCEFLSQCYLVVWMDNKNVDRAQINNFTKTMRNTYNITVNYMLFGLDRNVKSISLLRRHLAPTRLPFILIDHVINIYDRDDDQYTAVCDFDYYINLREYLVQSVNFYDLQLVMDHIRRFLVACAETFAKVAKKDKSGDHVRIVECDENEANAVAEGIDTEDEEEGSTRMSKRRRLDNDVDGGVVVTSSPTILNPFTSSRVQDNIFTVQIRPYDADEGSQRFRKNKARA